jgi:hypothetical protein
MKKLLFCATLAGCVALTSAAGARSAYDGAWDLTFVTQRGACDPTYNFSVNITNGIITHPNLVKFRGYVARSGAVRASVAVHKNSPPARAGSQEISVAALGAAVRGRRAARDTGTLNEISPRLE